MRYFFLCLLCLSTSFGFAASKQDSIPQNTSRFGISTSYFAESGYHHGFSIGMDCLIFNKNKPVEKKETKFRNHKLILSPSILWFYHPNNKSSFITKVDFSHRLTFKSGIFGTIGTGIGYFRTFYNIPTFQIKDGDLEKIQGAGRNTFTSNLFWSIGYDFFNKTNFPLSIMIQPELYIQAPYNHKYVVFPAWQMRFVYYFNSKKQ